MTPYSAAHLFVVILAKLANNVRRWVSSHRDARKTCAVVPFTKRLSRCARAALRALTMHNSMQLHTSCICCLVFQSGLAVVCKMTPSWNANAFVLFCTQLCCNDDPHNICTIMCVVCLVICCVQCIRRTDNKLTLAIVCTQKHTHGALTHHAQWARARTQRVIGVEIALTLRAQVECVCLCAYLAVPARSQPPRRASQPVYYDSANCRGAASVWCVFCDCVWSARVVHCLRRPLMLWLQRHTDETQIHTLNVCVTLHMYIIVDA